MRETPAAGGATPARTRQRLKTARPQQLLDAALLHFGSKGYAATRTETVAAAAGVSKGTLYLYYPSKQELFKAVIETNLAQLIAEGTGYVDAYTGATPALLAQLLLAWWQRVGNTPAAAIHRIVLAESANFPEVARYYDAAVIQPAEALLARVLERGMARGEFLPLPVREVTRALIAPLIFLSLRRMDPGPAEWAVPVDADRVIALHIEIALRGLAAPVTAAGAAADAAAPERTRTPAPDGAQAATAAPPHPTPRAG